MYYPCSENKGVDQLRGYREADLCLCFRIGKNPVFSRCGLSNSTILGTCKTSSLLNSAEYETFVCLYWGLTSPSTIFQSCPDGATASCVFTSTVTVGSSCVLLKDTTWCCQWGSNPGPRFRLSMLYHYTNALPMHEINPAYKISFETMNDCLW